MSEPNDRDQPAADQGAADGRADSADRRDETQRDETPRNETQRNETQRNDETDRGDETGGEDAVAAGPPPAPGLGALLRPRATKAQLVGGLLCLIVGFAFAAQARSTGVDSTFATARQDELVGILSNLGERSSRLRGDIQELEETRAELRGDGRGEAALEEARERATTYGLLAGTLPAEGPGIELTIHDPARKVRATVLLDALQELRDAGAEVIQVNEVRVGVDTYFTDADGGWIEADGRRLSSPYRFRVIGDPHTLTTALNIPGGVIKAVRSAGASGSIAERRRVTVEAVRSP